jgi:hypothetical protein
MVDQPKRGKGGDVKKAPPGFYTARQAYERLGMNKQQFYKNVGGLITRVVLPGSKNGFYRVEDIELLAVAREHALLGRKVPPSTFRVATAEDAQGIHDVIVSLGWPATPPEIRKSWLTVNPEIDWVVTPPGSNLIVGYISAVPYTPLVMERMMTGRIKGKDIKPEDILPFEPGKQYDLFVGLAERIKTKGEVQYANYGLRLVFGFRHVIWAWAERDIFIHRLMAHSAEEAGQDLASLLAFKQVPGVSGDLYPRYVFDFETSQSAFARRYRETWKKQER